MTAITIIRGDTPMIEVDLSASVGITSLTGFVAKMTARFENTKGTVAFTKTGTIVGMIITFELTAVDTAIEGKYYYDVEVSNSATSKIYTVDRPSVMNIIDDVTK